MENKYYYLLKVKFKKLHKIELENLNQLAFLKFHCQGIEEYDLDENAVDEVLGKDALLGAEVSEEIIEKIEQSTDSLSLNYLFQAEKDAIGFKNHLEENSAVQSCDLKKNEIEDWNKEWKKHFKSIEISPRLKVVPSWEPTKDLNNIILINPGMGFGTGSHETTFLCLKFLDELKTAPKKCLDFGCGSGILGIAAIKLFGVKVDFVDVSREALGNCYENLILNFKEESLEGSSVILRERFKPKEEYDLIFANILENVLLLEKDTIFSCLRSKGKLIISGLLNEQKKDFLEKFTRMHPLKLIESKSKGDWCAVYLEAP